ncbi:MAG: histidinol-phosphate transaminase, partial [Clostridia bacterium]|nr:histidinol-phosphate transaminase [Clostridia bacterium]
MSNFFLEKYNTLDAYVPGEQPQDKKYLKLNTNESPYPPSLRVLDAAFQEASRLNLYSDPE